MSNLTANCSYLQIQYVGFLAPGGTRLGAQIDLSATVQCVPSQEGDTCYRSGTVDFLWVGLNTAGAPTQSDLHTWRYTRILGEFSVHPSERVGKCLLQLVSDGSSGRTDSPGNMRYRQRLRTSNIRRDRVRQLPLR